MVIKRFVVVLLLSLLDAVVKKEILVLVQLTLLLILVLVL